MDVFDMHDNFIDGMAKAIRNSYIVLICINRKYDSSYWCKKGLEFIFLGFFFFIYFYINRNSRYCYKTH